MLRVRFTPLRRGGLPRVDQGEGRGLRSSRDVGASGSDFHHGAMPVGRTAPRRIESGPTAGLAVRRAWPVMGRGRPTTLARKRAPMSWVEIGLSGTGTKRVLPSRAADTRSTRQASGQVGKQGTGARVRVWRGSKNRGREKPREGEREREREREDKERRDEIAQQGKWQKTKKKKEKGLKR